MIRMMQRIARTPKVSTRVVLPYLAVAVIVGSSVYALTRPSPRVMIVSNLREGEGPVLQGGVLKLDAKVTRPVDCDPTAERWLWRWIDTKGIHMKQWVYLVGAPHAPPVDSPASENNEIIVPVPAYAAESGGWFYRGVIFPHCGETGDTPPMRTEDIPVSIIAPTEGHPAAVAVPPGAIHILPGSTP